jgi:hypothetical protein
MFQRQIAADVEKYLDPDAIDFRGFMKTRSVHGAKPFDSTIELNLFAHDISQIMQDEIRMLITGHVREDLLVKNCAVVETPKGESAPMVTGLQSQVKLYKGQTLTFDNEYGRADLLPKPYLMQFPIDLISRNQFDLVDYDSYLVRYMQDAYKKTIINNVLNGDIAAGGGFEGLFTNAAATGMETKTATFTTADLVALIRAIQVDNGNMVIINSELMTTILSATDTLTEYVRNSILQTGSFEGVQVYSTPLAPSENAPLAVGGKMMDYAINYNLFIIREINTVGNGTVVTMKVTYHLAGAMLNPDKFINLTLKA